MTILCSNALCINQIPKCTCQSFFINNNKSLVSFRVHEHFTISNVKPEAMQLECACVKFVTHKSI